jgi:hypothetical protein
LLILLFLERYRKITDFRQLFYENNLKTTFKSRKTGETIILPEPNEIRSQCGLEIHPNPIEVKGRIVEEPKIIGKGIFPLIVR